MEQKMTNNSKFFVFKHQLLDSIPPESMDSASTVSSPGVQVVTREELHKNRQIALQVQATISRQSNRNTSYKPNIISQRGVENKNKRPGNNSISNNNQSILDKTINSTKWTKPRGVSVPNPNPTQTKTNANTVMSPIKRPLNKLSFSSRKPFLPVHVPPRSPSPSLPPPSSSSTSSDMKILPPASFPAILPTLDESNKVSPPTMLATPIVNTPSGQNKNFDFEHHYQNESSDINLPKNHPPGQEEHLSLQGQEQIQIQSPQAQTTGTVKNIGPPLTRIVANDSRPVSAGPARARNEVKNPAVRPSTDGDAKVIDNVVSTEYVFSSESESPSPSHKQSKTKSAHSQRKSKKIKSKRLSSVKSKKRASSSVKKNAKKSVSPSRPSLKSKSKARASASASADSESKKENKISASRNQISSTSVVSSDWGSATTSSGSRGFYSNADTHTHDAIEEDDQDQELSPTTTTTTATATSSTVSTNTKNNTGSKKKPSTSQTPSVEKLLKNCVCYMNWIPATISGSLSEGQMQHLVEVIQMKVTPPPSGEFVSEESLRFEPIETISNLGALCFFHLELGQFVEAKETISKTQNFVDECVKSSIIPKAYISSFDYVWDFLRLYGSVKEWEKKERMSIFPEMNLLSFAAHFDKLKSRVRAGVYGIKQFFYRVIGVSLDKQIELLRKVILLDKDYFEWPCTLQCALRHRRKASICGRSSTKSSTTIGTDSLKEELNQSSQAYQLASSNPRCILGAIQALNEVTKVKLKNEDGSSSSKWEVIDFGSFHFHSASAVAKFVKEQAKKINKHVIKSIYINMQLADILTNALPPEYRDYDAGKSCLTRVLKFHPEYARANYKMALLYLNVEANHRQAEMYFDTSFSLNERHWPSLIDLIYCMMKNIEQRQENLLDLLKKQLDNPFWSKNQVATLHYLKGLVLLATGRNREAFEAFIYAYELNQSAFTFSELPTIHKKYGWSHSSPLSLANILQEAQRYKEKYSSESNRDKMTIVSVLIRTIENAKEKLTEQHSKHKNSNKKW